MLAIGVNGRCCTRCTFQGFSWQTVSARLGSAAMHAHVRVQAPPRYARVWVQRIAAQNDVESCYGVASKGSPAKPTPMLMGPRLDEMDVLDDIRHDEDRAADNTFCSRKVREGAKEGKRQRVGS